MQNRLQSNKYSGEMCRSYKLFHGCVKARSGTILPHLYCPAFGVGHWGSRFCEWTVLLHTQLDVVNCADRRRQVICARHPD
eukprot:SAG11_NODE_15401_length_579_cov_1.450000_1_plen_80_part_10